MSWINMNGIRSPDQDQDDFLNLMGNFLSRYISGEIFMHIQSLLTFSRDMSQSVENVLSYNGEESFKYI